MTIKAKKYLSDILQALELIEFFLEDTGTFASYQNDTKTKSAVERQLGIVGEAVNQFLKEENVFTLKNSRQIVYFRKRLIHS